VPSRSLRAGGGAIQGKHHNFGGTIAAKVCDEALGCNFEAGNANLCCAVRVGLDPALKIDLRQRHLLADA
jgi:hypothetical protein